MAKYESYEYKKEEQQAVEVLSMLSKMNFKSPENVYTQHTPLLADIIDSVRLGRLRESAFPYMGNQAISKPHEVIVFFVNGVTFEEAKWCAASNQSGASIKTVVGGTCIHNYQSFLKEVQLFK
jgi:vacuolar protein sorting-associated protein 45